MDPMRLSIVEGTYENKHILCCFMLALHLQSLYPYTMYTHRVLTLQIQSKRRCSEDGSHLTRFVLTMLDETTNSIQLVSTLFD